MRWGLGALLFQKNVPAFLLRVAQGSHKVIIGQVVPCRPGGQSGQNNARHTSAFSALHNAGTVFTTQSISLLQSRFLYYRLDFITTESTSLLTDAISFAQSRFLYYRVDFVFTEPISLLQSRSLLSSRFLYYRAPFVTTDSISLLQSRSLY